MTRMKLISRWPTVTVGVALSAAMLIGGCQTKSHHAENVNEANDRWVMVRSSMMLEMATQQFETGDLDMAARTVRDAMQIDATNARLNTLAGRISLERGQLERSYHLFEAAIRIDVHHAPAHYYKGLVHQRWRQYDRAHASYRAAYDAQPDDAGYLMAAAEMLIELDRTDDAIQMLESRLTYFDQNSALRAALGHFHIMNGRPDQAARYFRRAALLDPDNVKLHEELALAQLAAGETDAAIKALRQLLRDPEHEDRRDLRLTLARAHQDAGQVKEAREHFLVLARGDRAEVGDWLRLAELSWADKDLDGTLYAANRAISMDPRRHESFLLAGLVWQQREGTDEALRMFDRAAELAPGNAAPLILRGITLQRAGRPTAAAEAYQKALDRDPDDTRARRLLGQVSRAD